MDVEGWEVLRTMIETSLGEVGPEVFGEHGESAEVVVAVAFGVGDAKESDDGEVLVEGDGADVGQVFGCEVKGLRGFGLAFAQECGVGEAFDDAFAVLVAGAGVAEFEGGGQAAEGAFGLVDDEGRAVRPASQVVLQGDIAVQGLLDEEESVEEFPYGIVFPAGFVKCSEGVDVGELFVAVEGELGLLYFAGFKDCGDVAEAVQVGVAVAWLEALGVRIEGYFDVDPRKVGEPRKGLKSHSL